MANNYPGNGAFVPQSVPRCFPTFVPLLSHDFGVGHFWTKSLKIKCKSTVPSWDTLWDKPKMLHQSCLISPPFRGGETDEQGWDTYGTAEIFA